MPPDPSLFNLVAPNYQNQIFTSTVDILNILGTQIEEVILHSAMAPHIYLGMQTFSAFELFATHYADLAQQSEKLTVFGHADKQPFQMPNTEFIALPQDATLTRERFLVINHPVWQVALIAQEDAENVSRWGRQLRYHGLLTFNPKVVERCNMVAALLSGNRPQPVTSGETTRQQYHIAQLVTRTVMLTNLPEFEPAHVLNEAPKLLTLAQQLKPFTTLADRINWLVQIGQRLLNVPHLTLYRNENTMLRPIASTTAIETLSGVVAGQGVVGQAAQQAQPQTDTGTDIAALTGNPAYQAALALPLYNAQQSGLWGVALLASENINAIQALQNHMALAIFEGILQTVILKDALAVNGKTTTNNGVQAAPNADAMPTPDGNAPIPSTSDTTPAYPTTRKPTRGRIRLGPREAPAEAAAPVAENADLELVRLPQAQTITVQEDPLADYQRRIIGHLLSFDRDGADRVWREAYSRFPARDLCVNLLQPVLIAVGEGWHRGQVSVAAEHFTTSYVESKIVGFLNSYPDNPNGATILTGCAQGETHETGIMMLSLFFRWDGHKVIYLGANVPNSTLEDALKTIKPDMLCLSATMKENGNNLTEVGHIMTRLPEPRPLFGFGGSAFIFFPELRERVNGHYLGDEPNIILKNVRDLLDTRRQRLNSLNGKV